jgi:hypothetical protein
MALGALIAGIDDVVGEDPAALGVPDTIVELERQLARLEAVVTRAAAAFDASQAWQDDGARTAAAWMTNRCNLPKTTARHRVGLGRRLRHLPACERAWLAGDVTGHHASVLAAARRPATADRLAEDEEMLVGEAKHLTFGHFVKAVRYWELHANPDGSHRRDEDNFDARRVHLSKSLDDMWFGNMVLDPISGALVSGELSRIEDELFKADWAAAKRRLGRAPTSDEMDRTPAQRRADALAEMAIRSRTAPADGRRPAPLFTVLVGWETLHGLICELADGTVVGPGALVPWLDVARLERVVFGADSRVIDVGIRRRLFRGATRRAVEVERRECYHAFCDLPADQCQADHIVPWADGGPTVVANGQLACDFHNRRRAGRPPPRGPSDADEPDEPDDLDDDDVDDPDDP